MRPWVAVALLAALLPAARAQAFVRSTTQRGTPIFWGGSCAFLAPDTDLPAELTQAAVAAAVDRASANWRSAAPGAYLQLHAQPAAPAEAKNDGKSIIKFRKDKWCRPAEPRQPELCFSPAASGITTVFYISSAGSAQDGQITDADIELNAVHFTFVNQPSTVPARPGTLLADLENTLTHELGHFQGLGHTCWDHVVVDQPKDDQGNPLPDCLDLDKLPAAVKAKITGATMYNYATPGEISKRTVQPDDSAGMTAIYPLARDPKQCEAPGSGGCGTAAPASGLLGELWALLAVALVRGRRRHRSST